jgi:hypothetical protein
MESQIPMPLDRALDFLWKEFSFWMNLSGSKHHLESRKQAIAADRNYAKRAKLSDYRKKPELPATTIPALPSADNVLPPTPLLSLPSAVSNSPLHSTATALALPSASAPILQTSPTQLPTTDNMALASSVQPSTSGGLACSDLQGLQLTIVHF